MNPDTQRYLSAFCEFASSKGLGPVTPAGNKVYVSFPKAIQVPDSKFETRVRVNHDKGLIEVRLAIKGKKKKLRHEALMKQSEELKSQIGEDIQFKGTKSTVFAVRLLKKVDLSNESDWPQQHKWLLENVQKFLEVFPPIIHAIVAEESAGKGE